jgi:ribosomal protein S18 acetylase RimI-like enzyme
MIEIRPFQIEDEAAVVQLWQQCQLTRSSNDPHRDILAKMAVQPDLFLVGAIDGRLVATLMAGYEGHRGWLNYLAVAPDCRNRGYGRHMVAAAEKRLHLLGCPKINLQVRSDNVDALDFYRKLGFCTDHVISLGKRLDNQ